MKTHIYLFLFLPFLATAQQDENPPSLSDTLITTTNNDMVWVEGGSFQMQNKVNVSLSGFYLSKYEVTMEEYDAFCEATGKAKPSDEGWGRDRRPAMNLSWYSAVEYCNWRSSQEGLSLCYNINKNSQDPNNISSTDNIKWTVNCNWEANGYRLPTEAEWEYAARGGKQTKGYKYAGSKAVDDVAIYEANSSSKTATVGSKKANKLGIYDMSGNILEWCWDWYKSDISSRVMNPKGSISGSHRLLRGGSWGDDESYCTVLRRYSGDPRDEYYGCGFRLAKTK